MPHVLVVANETVGGAKLLQAVRDRAEKDPETRFTLVVPMTRPRSGLVIYDEAVRDAAQVRVDLATAFMRREGINADGEVGDGDPYTAVMDALHGGGYDEVIVSTHPETTSGWLRRGLVERIIDDSGLPVEHVVTDIDAEGLLANVTVVVANRTAVSDSLVGRLKEKAANTDQPQLFIIVVPQDDRDGKAAAVARARLGNALDRLRSEGLLAAGMIGDPDPYDATMNALQFYHADEVLISTLPETRSGWMRSDLIGRVKKSTDVPVEHVVAEREGAVAAEANA